MVFRISGEFRRFRPHVVQCWMYHANLLGGIAATLGGRIPVVWGIHHGDTTSRDTKILNWKLPKGVASPLRIALRSILPFRVLPDSTRRYIGNSL